MSIQKIVLNAPVATAGDLTTPGGGKVNVTGDPNGFLRNQVQEFKLQYFNPEVLESVTITATPAANTDYEFYIEQDVDGSVTPNKLLVAVTTVASPSAAVLRDALTANVQAFIDSGQLKATAVGSTSGSDAVVTITGLTGFAPFRILQAVNVTEASLLLNVASTSTDFSGVAATGVITMEVASTAGVAVGQIHHVTWTGNTETINGSLGTAGTKLRVSAILAGPARIQYIADEISGDFTGDDSVSQLVATKPRVLGADLIAQGVTDAVAAGIYHEVIVLAKQESGDTLTVPGHQDFEKHYYIRDTADGLLLMARFGEVKDWFAAGGSTVDPALM